MASPQSPVPGHIHEAERTLLLPSCRGNFFFAAMMTMRSIRQRTRYFPDAVMWPGRHSFTDGDWSSVFALSPCLSRLKRSEYWLTESDEIDCAIAIAATRDESQGAWDGVCFSNALTAGTLYLAPPPLSLYSVPLKPTSPARRQLRDELCRVATTTPHNQLDPTTTYLKESRPSAVSAMSQDPSEHE